MADPEVAWMCIINYLINYLTIMNFIIVKPVLRSWIINHTYDVNTKQAGVSCSPHC